MNIKEEYDQAKAVYEAIRQAENEAWKKMMSSNFSIEDCKVYEAMRQAEDQAWHQRMWAEKKYKKTLNK